MVWSCFPFIGSGQNHLARHSERGKKTRQTKEEVGRQHQGMDRPGLRQVPEGSGEQGKMEKTGCKIICGAPMTLAVKGLMMMMMITNTAVYRNGLSQRMSVDWNNMDSSTVCSKTVNQILSPVFFCLTFKMIFLLSLFFFFWYRPHFPFAIISELLVAVVFCHFYVSVKLTGTSTVYWPL